MAIPLKQSTASQVIPLGPFLDSTDGVTAKTALTIANTDIKLWVAGATTLANKNSGGATHISNGIYYCTLDATDTATVGPFVVFVSVATALPIKVECVVQPANLYDSLVSGSSVLQVNSTQFAGQTITAAAGVTLPSSVASPTNITAGTITTVSGNVTGSVGSVVGLTASNLDAAVSSRMATYTQPTGFLAATFPATVASTTNITAGTITTVTNLTNAPTSGDLTATMKASVSAAVLDEATASHLSAGTVGLAVRDADLRGSRVVVRGTSDVGATTTTMTVSALSPSGTATDQFKGRIIIFDAATTTAALRGQATDITANTAAALPAFTFTALTTAPSSGDTFTIV